MKTTTFAVAATSLLQLAAAQPWSKSHYNEKKAIANVIKESAATLMNISMKKRTMWLSQL